MASLVLFAAFVFWKPLNEIVSTIPHLVDSSDSLSIGGLSLHVKRRLAEEASLQVRNVLRQLDADDIREILAHGTKGGVSLVAIAPANRAVLERCSRWEQLGLIRKLSEQEMAKVREINRDPAPPDWPFETYAWHPTALFIDTAEFLSNIVPEALSELKLEIATELK